MTTYPQLRSRRSYQAYYDDLAGVRKHRIVKYNPYRMQYFHPQPGEMILDLGCGTGGNAIQYAMWGCHVVGVEMAAGFLDAAREMTRKHFAAIADRLTWIQGCIEQVQLGRQFDHVLLTEVLEHVLDPMVVVQMAADHLKPTGEAYITAPSARIGSNSHVRGVDVSQLDEWLATAGLKRKWYVTQPNKPENPVYHTTICKAVRHARSAD